MLGMFKSKGSPANNGLFMVLIKVERGTNSEMPEPLIGAVVPAFVAAENHELAIKAAVSKLRSQGFVFTAIQGQVSQLDPALWTDYVRHTWSEFEQHFPTQQELLGTMQVGGVFFGPFAGYERT
jgi:hypothetical protein